MAMHTINLIPRSRRISRQRANRIRLWAGLGSIYSALVLIGCLVFRGLTPGADVGTMQDELDSLSAELAQVQSRQQAVTPRLNEQRVILAAERAISDQPDWSLLLAHLANDLLGDRIVLKACSLTPADGPVDAHALNEATLALTLTGYGRTTKDVSQFVLRLESSGLFDNVKLINTNLEPYLQDQAIVFEARCLMQQGGDG